jgi:hypothetical protein
MPAPKKQPTAKDQSGRTVPEMVLYRFEQLKAGRTNWDTYWQELAEYFIPNKDDVYGFRSGGEEKFNKLYDSTSVQALENLSASLHGMMTNPASVWFALSTGDTALDTDPEVAKYLETCTRIMIDTFNKSNFQEEIHEVYMDLGGIGTTVLDMEEDEVDDIRFRSRPIYSSYISENSKAVVDTLYRSEKMSLRNIKERFGDQIFKDKEDLNRKLEKDPEQTEEVVFGIEPDKERKGKFIGRWVSKTYKYLLDEAAYHSWPFAVPRWTKINTEVYGRCPAMKCLPDVRMLNAVMRTTIRGLQKVVDPPLMIPDNGFLLPINTTPGGSNFYRAGIKDRIEPFPTTARPDIGLDFVDNIRKRVEQAFYSDQLQLIQQRDMTATEVMQRTDERLRFLGPILGRLNNELLKPIIDRTFDILSRRGKFPKPPLALSRKPDLRIIYTSQIAKAQRTGEANTLQKVLQVSLPVVQAQPDVMDNFNGDKIVRYNASLFGLPTEFLNDPKDIKATRAARAKAQQDAMAAQQENIAADTKQKNAKAGAVA